MLDIRARYLPPPTDADIRRLCELELETKECLEDFEYDIGEPISEDQYVEEYNSKDGPPWQAYRETFPNRLARRME